MVACSSILTILFTLFAVSRFVGRLWIDVVNEGVSQLPETKGLSLEQIDELVMNAPNPDADNETNRLVQSADAFVA